MSHPSSHNAYIKFINDEPIDEDQRVKGAKDFIQSVADRGLNFLANENLSFRDRKRQFRTLLSESFDIRTIGRFSIGRYWRKATQAQRDEFLKLFEEMIISIYSNRFDEYTGQQLEIVGGRPEGKRDAIIATKIISPNGPDVLVRWRIRYNDGNYQIIDVIIEGVSMLVTQRSDFAAVIQRGGGNVEALLDTMRTRVAQAKTVQ